MNKNKETQPINRLFQLINSMTTGERRFFKLHAKKQQGQSLYIQLFDIISRKKNKDKTKILQSFKEKYDVKDMPGVQHYLFQFILESLALQSMDKPLIKLRQDITFFEILLNKGLLEQAYKLLKKLKKRAFELDAQELLLHLYRYEDQIIRAIYPPHESQKSIQKMFAERVLTIKRYQNYIAYRELCINVKYNRDKIQDTRAYEEVGKLKNFLAHPLLASDQPLTQTAKLNYYTTLFLITSGIGDLESAKEHMWSMKEYMKSENFYKVNKDYASDLLTTYTNYLNICLIQKNDSVGFLKVYEEFKSVGLSKKNQLDFLQKANFFATRYSLLLYYYWAFKEYQTIADIENEIITGLKVYKKYLTPNLHDIILFFMSRLFFCIQEYDKALHWCNQLLESQKKSISYTVQSYGNLLNLMIHFELGNYTMLNSLADAARYFLKSRKRFFETEQYIIQFFKKIKGYESRNDFNILFAEFYKELEKIIEKPKEKNFEEELCILDWAKSK